MLSKLENEDMERKTWRKKELFIGLDKPFLICSKKKAFGLKYFQSIMILKTLFSIQTSSVHGLLEVRNV